MRPVVALERLAGATRLRSLAVSPVSERIDTATTGLRSRPVRPRTGISPCLA